MKKIPIGVFYTVMFTVLISGCGQNGNKVFKLDSFEGELSKETVDFRASSNSSINVSVSKDAQCGKQALQLDYELGEEGYLFCARGYGLDVSNALWEAPAPEDIRWQDYQSISFKMMGQGSGSVAFDVKDSGGEMWRFIVEDVAEGWKDVKISFDQFFVRTDWQPSTSDGNKELNFPLKSFQFEPKGLGKGTLLFDCVQLVYVENNINKESSEKGGI